MSNEKCHSTQGGTSVKHLCGSCRFTNLALPDKVKYTAQKQPFIGVLMKRCSQNMQ